MTDDVSPIEYSNDNSKYLWIGEHTNKEVQALLLKFGYSPQSSSIAQAHFLTGLRSFIKIDTLSSTRLPGFKKNKRLFFPSFKWQDSDKSTHVFVKLSTIRYFELFYKTIKLKKEARLWAKENKKYKCNIIIYSLHSPYLSLIPIFKKIIPNVQFTCIAPDLPEYFDFDMSFIKKTLKKVESYFFPKLIKRVDKFVLFNKKMATKLKIEKGKYLIINGLVDKNESADNDKGLFRSDDKKVQILYTGAVSSGYGIELLINAFNLIDKPNIFLAIAGAGNLSDYVKNASLVNKRINYLGYLDRKIIREKQFSSSILVNMIPPTNLATQYAFPSKIFEYMTTGNPVLSFKLDCFEENYNDYLVFFEDQKIESIAKSIVTVSDDLERYRTQVGLKAKRFVEETKDRNKQAARLINYIKNNIITDENGK